MGWFANLFSTPKIISTLADTVKAGTGMLDKAFFTDEERAEAASKIMDVLLKVQVSTAEENSIRSVTRRIMAWAIIGVFLILILAMCVIWPFNPAWAVYILSVIEGTQLSLLTMGVGIFYFGYYGVAQITRKK